jgi:hypothetical protein
MTIRPSIFFSQKQTVKIAVVNEDQQVLEIGTLNLQRGSLEGTEKIPVAGIRYENIRLVRENEDFFLAWKESDGVAQVLNLITLERHTVSGSIWKM